MKKLLMIVGAAAVGALLPMAANAETHTLQPYAYVQSYGVNAVDTGCYATKTTKYFIDFEYTLLNDKRGLMGAAQTGGARHIIYNTKTSAVNNKFTDLSCVAMDKSANGHVAASVGTRYISTLNLSAKTLTTTNYNTRAYFGTVTVTGTTDGRDMTIPTYLFAVNTSADAQSVTLSTSEPPALAKIYSFEMDSPTLPGTPAAFFAPTTDASGNAGFTNILAGTFHGEVSPTATTALTYTSGIGNATDYKYEDSTFYAKFHAYANDTDMGGVAFGSDAASGTAEAWVERGVTTTLTAVPATGYVFIGWTGDTWAITEGNTATASITVKSGKAIQLLAEFAPSPTLTLSSSASWSAGSWLSGSDSVSAPVSGWARVVATSSATLTLDTDVALDGLIVECSGGATLTIAKAANATCSATEIVANGNIALDIPSGTGLSCGTLTFAENATLMADSDVRGLGAAAVSGGLDLAGHKLTVKGLGTAAGTITSTVAGGVLEIDVDSGTTVDNSAVELTGGANLQVWKSGDGTLKMTKVNSGFGGEGVTSLVIKAGIVQRDTGTTARATFGANNSTIVVEDGGQFDIANNSGTVYYDFVLAGAGPDGLGALALRPTDISGNGYDNAYSIRHITLSADAAIGTNSKIGLKYTTNFADHNVILNNHTLTLTNGTVYAGAFTVVGGGRIVVGENASFSFYQHNVSAPDCDVIVYGTIRENADVSPVAGGFSAVKSLVFETGSRLSDDKSRHMTNVIYERYAPPMTFGGSYKHLNVTLGNAEHLATSLDLTRFTGAFDGTTTTFYTGSTATVDLAGRADLRTISKSASPYIITWSDVPENVTFVPDEQTGKAGYRLIPESTGLKLECHKGFIISVY